jgi:hypothetical protein
MKKKLFIGGVVGFTALAISVLMLQPGFASHTTAKHGSDFALFDETGGDFSVSCGSAVTGTNQNNKAYEVHIAMRAINGDAVMRVTFVDGDFVDFPIPDGTSFSMSQAAGGTPAVDGEVTVTSVGAGQLVGWMSANFYPAGAGRWVYCVTE